ALSVRRSIRGLLVGSVLFSCRAGTTKGADQIAGPAAAALDAIQVEPLMADIKVLSSDSLLGRLPGSLGEERTVAFLEHEFKRIGLAPGNPDGTYIQNVPLVGITPDPSTSLVVTKGAERKVLKFKDDVVAWTKHVSDSVSIVNSDLVFVGYGVESPEYEWDDYKGTDVGGKTLVMLVNDPPLPDSTQFGGKAMTYYGR